ncbi:hypothetical protein MAPG_08789 [Magnaporthiopsis poae ATCC 64411]|uniref:Uncharacterized protein n=1 Tax=Magnaporthiopsis poae (strain ATCC 64411 / 73-15) TaxID=644358 RepID=A0A0C4E892_MAGP6|nr:hypothetical protein MAPG_08789 [Magnaporthiopsis poae ATCC 64411]
MRFSLIFQLGALAALSAPVLAWGGAASDTARLAARGVEEATYGELHTLEARRDPGKDALPKRPPPKIPAPRWPVERGDGPAPTRGKGKTVLGARRDPGKDALSKRSPPKIPAPRWPVERGNDPAPVRGTGETVRTRPGRGRR